MTGYAVAGTERTVTIGAFRHAIAMASDRPNTFYAMVEDVWYGYEVDGDYTNQLSFGLCTDVEDAARRLRLRLAFGRLEIVKDTNL